MTISVVIATYNRASLLRECLERFVAQSFEPGDEIIVVDNASTDGTCDVIGHLSLRLPVPLRYLREATPGKTPALIAGIAAARGDVLAFTDDDVLVGEDWIASVRRLFANPELALAGGRVDPRWERAAPRWLEVEKNGAYGRMTSPLALLHYGDAQELGARTAVGANMAVRRAVLEAVGGFSPALGRFRDTLLCGEDHEFCQRVGAAGYRREYRPEMRAHHWVPSERLSLRYYFRWFWWSGITHARLESAEAGSRRRLSHRYVWGRLLQSPARAVGSLLTARPSRAVTHLMEAAFSAGYVFGHTTEKRQEIRAKRQQAPQLPASARSPAIPAPDPQGGS